MKLKDSFSRKVFNVFNIVFFICMMIVVLFPYFNVFAKAFNDGHDTAMGGITIFPRKFTLENFSAVMEDEAFLRALILTISITIIGTFVSILVQYMAAYAFLNKNLVGRGCLLIFFVLWGRFDTYIHFIF